MASHQYSARNNIFSGTQFAGCQIYSMGWDYPEKETVTDMVKAYVNCQKKTKVYYYNKITQDNRQFEEKCSCPAEKMQATNLAKWSISHK